MQISYNYTSRTKDISILQTPNPEATGAVAVSPSFGIYPKFCAGVQKLVQKYIIILLTNLESQPNYSDFGTSLLYTLKAGISPVDKIAASQIFSLASYTAVNILKSYQSETVDIPLDERIVNATLTDLTLRGDTAAFNVAISTEAGDNISFLVPLPN